MDCIHCGTKLPEGARTCPKCGANVYTDARRLKTAFDQCILEHSLEFTGRKWVFREIELWLANPQSPRVFLIQGGPGSGKTALAAQLAQLNQGEIACEGAPHLHAGYLTYAHFCMAGKDSTLDAMMFIKMLSLQMANRFTSFGESLINAQDQNIEIAINQTVDTLQNGQMIGMIIHDLTIRGLSARVAFQRTVWQPLEQLCGPDFNQTILILVDAIDEAVNYSQDESLSALLERISATDYDLPQQVRFIFTSRPGPAWLNNINAMRLELSETEPCDTQDQKPGDSTILIHEDICNYARTRLVAWPEARREELSERIVSASKGNFLYARYKLNEILASPQLAENPDQLVLPEGLKGIYHEFLRHHFRLDHQQWLKDYSPIFGLLTVARSPGLTRTNLAEMTGFQESQVEGILSASKPFLNGAFPNGPFSIFHESFREFLLEDSNYDVFPAEADLILGEYFMEKFQGQWLDCTDEYALHHTPYHIGRALRQLNDPRQLSRRRNLLTGLRTMLLDYGWLEARLNATDINTLISDYDLALSAEMRSNGSEDARTEQALTIIRGGLRLHAHVLQADKSQLAAQLWGCLMTCPEREVQAFLEQARQLCRHPWLRTLTASFLPSGGALVCTLLGHTDEVTAVAVTPNGKKILSGSKDKTVRVWDASTLKMELVFEGHTDTVWGVSASPDSQYAISAGQDGNLKYWDLVTSREIRTLSGHEGPVRFVEFLADSQHAVSASDDCKLKVWDLKNGEVAYTLEGHTKPVMGLAVAQDGSRAVSAAWDGRLMVWDLRNGRMDEACARIDFLADRSWKPEIVVPRPEMDEKIGLALTPDGKQACISSSHGICLWDLETGRIVKKLERPFISILKEAWYFQTGQLHGNLAGPSDWVVALAFSLDGKQVVYASQQMVGTWHLDGKARNQDIPAHLSSIWSVAVMPDGRKAVTASADYSLRVLDLESDWRNAYKVAGHAGDISGVRIAPNDCCAISCGSDNLLKVWDLTNGRLLKTLIGHKEAVTTLDLTSDGQHIISGSSDKTVRIWGLKTGRMERILKGHADGVVAVTLAGNDRVLSVDKAGNLFLWNWRKGKSLITIPGKANDVYALKCSPDSKYALVFAREAVQIWNLENGVCQWEQSGMFYSYLQRNAPATKDGAWMVLAQADDTLTVCDVNTGENKFSLSGDVKAVSQIGISADGKYLALGLINGVISIWDVDTGTLIHTLMGWNCVSALSFSPDGRQVLAAYLDGTFQIWDLQTGQLVASFTGVYGMAYCGAGSDGHSFVAAEWNTRFFILCLESGVAR